MQYLQSIVIIATILASQGKTNQHGLKIFGRALRHKDVALCPFGALSFYLANRFSNTKEFEDFTLDDWKDNSKWFDVKLLVDTTRPELDKCRSMKNDTYAKAIKTVLEALGIKSSHWVHLGRVTGPKILEMQEMRPDEIRRLGNWDPYIQEKHYSAKLPMKPMRSIGGFTVAKGMYYNPRTTVNPLMEVVLKTPFKFAYNFCDAIWASVVNDDSPGSTAHTFLSLMKNVGVIFIQDATALWILHEDRRTHPLFHLDVFQSQEWKVSLFDLLQCLACHILCFIKYFFHALNA